MNIYSTLSPELISKLIPNVIESVEGEQDLFTSLAPFIEGADQWITVHIVGNVELDPHLLFMMQRLVVTMAFQQAVPSLDLVVTPNGFGIVNTQSIAPASKERVERLIESLTQSVNVQLTELVNQLHYCDAWLESERGKWFGESLLSDLTQVKLYAKDGDFFDTFLKMRALAIEFEHIAASECLGQPLMAKIIADNHVRAENETRVHWLVRNAEHEFIHSRFGKVETAPRDPEYAVWHLLRSAMAVLPKFPELQQLWDADKGAHFKTTPFQNDIQGGYYF
jgi:hypothetical protein